MPSSEIARCKPLDRTAISEELRRLWDALSDDQRKVYDQKADELRGEMARERLIAARTARDRAVEAALELGAKDRDARLIAARQTKQLFPDVDWEQLVKPSVTQRGFLQFLNLNFASMASTRCHTAVTPSTWPCESLRVS